MMNNILFHVANHWIAGETYQGAIQRAMKSSTLNIASIINLLGEDVTDRRTIDLNADEYIHILTEINSINRLQCCISIKPTQLGLTIDKTLFRERLTRVLQVAKSFNNFVWIDMESSTQKEETIEAYLSSRKEFDNVGIAVQAYLKKSQEDVHRLLDGKAIIRLVKGAYHETPELVYTHREQISQNFRTLMEMLFRSGNMFALGTHDEKLIEEAIKLNEASDAKFEFEMLMGIRDKKKIELVSRGYRVSEYIPYGTEWWAYSKRRILEHKSNILLLARSLVSG